ncbi:MAG: hypothetical protein ACYTFM_09780, partial [Planctomycetota bacterium]
MAEEINKSQSPRNSQDQNGLICSLPLIPERQLEEVVNPYIESLIRYIEKKWVNHTVLHYHFLEVQEAWKGDESQKQVVRDSFKEWKDLGIGLEFKEVSNAADAEIRIGFESG